MFWNKSSAPAYDCIKFTDEEKKEKRKETFIFKDAPRFSQSGMMIISKEEPRTLCSWQ